MVIKEKKNNLKYKLRIKKKKIEYLIIYMIKKLNSFI
jgi:hypothetical protein